MSATTTSGCVRCWTTDVRRYGADDRFHVFIKFIVPILIPGQDLALFILKVARGSPSLFSPPFVINVIQRYGNILMSIDLVDIYFLGIGFMRK